jgi:hypothetical protein
MHWQVRAMKYETALRGIRAGLASERRVNSAAWWAYNECDKALEEIERGLDDTNKEEPAAAGSGG